MQGANFSAQARVHTDKCSCFLFAHTDDVVAVPSHRVRRRQDRGHLPVEPAPALRQHQQRAQVAVTTVFRPR